MCLRPVIGAELCQLPYEHHGPCTHGRAQRFNENTCPRGARPPMWHGSHMSIARGKKRCAACDLIDAIEVLRLADGGEFRPLQERPPWMHPNSKQRERTIAWARKRIAEAGK